jgi:type 1 fimbriae regulatory protein FimB/type 1 fimbriae regulatory protein FimE
MRARLRLVTPRNQNVGPSRPTNVELRARQYLTPDAIKRLIKAARDGGRYGHLDATMILIGYRHGLRASEIADLEWSQVEFGRNATLHVRRAKNGKPSTHPLRGDEVRALRELRRQSPDATFVFATERGGPFTADAINRHVKRIGWRAGLPAVHAHMLRHGCGYALANAGHDTRAIQDWLGHRSIQHTVRYTELSPTRFRDFWRDRVAKLDESIACGLDSASRCRLTSGVPSRPVVAEEGAPKVGRQDVIEIGRMPSRT